MCVRGIGTIGGRPVDFISPPSGRPGRSAGGVVRGAPARGWSSVPLFFSGFLPLFSGASGFRVAVFLRSFRYSRVVPPLRLSLSASIAATRVSLLFPPPPPPLALLATPIGTYPSLLPLLFALLLAPSTLPPPPQHALRLPSALAPFFSGLLLLFFVNRLPRARSFVLLSELCRAATKSILDV